MIRVILCTIHVVNCSEVVGKKYKTHVKGTGTRAGGGRVKHTKSLFLNNKYEKIIKYKKMRALNGVKLFTPWLFSEPILVANTGTRNYRNKRSGTIRHLTRGTPTKTQFQRNMAAMPKYN